MDLFLCCEVNVKNCQNVLKFFTSVFITETVKISFSFPNGAVEEKHHTMAPFRRQHFRRLARGVGDLRQIFQYTGFFQITFLLVSSVLYFRLNSFLIIGFLKKKEKHAKLWETVVFLGKGGLGDSQVLGPQGPGSQRRARGCPLSNLTNVEATQGQSEALARACALAQFGGCPIISNCMLPVIFRSYSVPLGTRGVFRVQECLPFPLRGNTK